MLQLQNKLPLYVYPTLPDEAFNENTVELWALGNATARAEQLDFYSQFFKSLLEQCNIECKLELVQSTDASPDGHFPFIISQNKVVCRDKIVEFIKTISPRPLAELTSEQSVICDLIERQIYPATELCRWGRWKSYSAYCNWLGIGCSAKAIAWYFWHSEARQRREHLGLESKSTAEWDAIISDSVGALRTLDDWLEPRFPLDLKSEPESLRAAISAAVRSIADCPIPTELSAALRKDSSLLKYIWVCDAVEDGVDKTEEK